MFCCVLVALEDGGFDLVLSFPRGRRLRLMPVFAEESPRGKVYGDKLFDVVMYEQPPPSQTTLSSEGKPRQDMHPRFYHQTILEETAFSAPCW